ncbi:MAG: signal peptidase I [Spirochaetales bacterium]|uniref:Signal peptidase I n=1 Tax=Candidatus Thalassospirochaeta sargassi TaxID=3119039 RepID=A0AAJ1IM09_9SPIO|nr:signal peptidase I [Spirochaetales bacterium]
MNSFSDNVQFKTEQFLGWRKRRRRIKKEKEKQKNPVVDWIEAFLWAAVVVLLLNQYLFQAYTIPTPSMVDTLQIKDRLFVNKMIFGPELVPGQFKTSTGRIPYRNEIIIFESPTYLSKGPVFDVAQRLIYMITFSLVDIDRDQNGDPKPHFLIKRSMAHAGDQIRLIDGEVELKPAGYTEWIQESDFKPLVDKDYVTKRMIGKENYTAIRASAFIDAADYAGIETNAVWNDEYNSLNTPYTDMYSWSGYRYQAMYEINPHLHQYGAAWRKTDSGWFIPEGWIFPMGDNRDNSRDGRYFGPVNLDNVLGKASFIYWPLNRIRKIK